MKSFRAVAAVGVVMAGAIGACSSSTAGSSGAPANDGGALDGATEAGLDTRGPLTRPLACSGEGVTHEPMPGEEIFAALRTAMGVDFLERRVVPDTDAGPQGWPLLSVGAACSRATSAAGCMSALATLSSNGEVLLPFNLDTFAFRPKGFYLVYSKGDAVGKISNTGELRALLPGVDTPVAALIQAEAASYRVECTADWIREEPDGFVVLTSKGAPCSRDRIVVFVRRDGTLEERSKVPGTHGSSACL